MKPKRARQPAATRRNFAAPLCCALMVAGLWLHTAPAASGDSSPQGDSWQSIRALPNWDGVWALTIEGHLHAAAESDDVSAPGKAVPLTPKYSQLRHNTQSCPTCAQDISKLKDTQEALSYCLPAGVPGIMLHTIQYEFLYTPGRVSMLTENGEVRRFYTDGRRHRSLDELTKSYEGDSIGHWEGDTLVVDTIGFPKGTLLQNGNVTSTLHSHYIERIHLKDKDHLQIDSSLDDPEIFTQPFKATRIYERLPPTYTMSEPQCSQTNRDTGDSVDLTPPKD